MMIAGSKRSRERASLDEPASKRRRNELPSDTNFLSRVDIYISKFGHWLRTIFGRNARRSRMTMSLVDRDELSQRESVLLEPTPLVNEDRHFDLGGNKSSTAKEDRTLSHTVAFSKRPSHSRNTQRSSVKDKEQTPLLSPVLNTMRKKHEERMFEQLLGKPLDDSVIEEVAPKDRSSHTTKSTKPRIKLYSVDYLSSTPLTHQRPLLATRPLSSLQQNSRTPFMRDPSLTLSSPLLTSFSTASPINGHSPSSPPVSAAQPSEKPEVVFVPTRINKSTVNGLSSSSRSNSSSISDWITSIRDEFTVSDYQARLEVAKKYARIHQEERMRADDERAQKLTELMSDLKVRPWAPEILDDTNKLNFYFEKDINKMIDEVWEPGNMQKVHSEGYNIKIRGSDLQTLRGLEWLNDEIINFYLNMIIETVSSEGRKRVHLFNSFFYPKIMSAGYSGVRRWTKKIDIFSFDLILLPVHLGMHWCLAAIDFKKKQIGYFDSLQGSNRKCLLTLRDYLVLEARDKKQMEYDVSEWTLECFTDIPTQRNGSDCGVFTCMYARHLARDKLFNFSQKDMPHIRRMMVAEIITKQLL